MEPQTNFLSFFLIKKLEPSISDEYSKKNILINLRFLPCQRIRTAEFAVRENSLNQAWKLLTAARCQWKTAFKFRIFSF